MKVLHTSDWHLGHTLYGKTRINEHMAFIHWLLALVEQEQIDAVIIAGDIFDTGTPPSYARHIYHDELVIKLDQLGCQLVVLGGNHDSVSMLSESASLLKKFNTHVIAGVCSDPSLQVVVLNDKNGTPAALVCAIPFIRAKDVVTPSANESARDKQTALTNGMKQHFDAIYELTKERKNHLETANNCADIPIIATGHLTAMGSSLSDSVRDIYVGTLDAFPTDLFPPADYIALGHIHKPSKVGGHEHIRYSGSPIHLSFDETHYEKNVNIIEFNQSSTPQIQAVTVPRFQYLKSLTGDLATLKQAFIQIASELEGKEEDSRAWVEVIVETDDYLTNLNKYIDEFIDGKPIDVLRIRRANTQKTPVLTIGNKQSLNELKPMDVFEKRLQEELLIPETRERLIGNFKLVLQEIHSADENEHLQQEATKKDASSKKKAINVDETELEK